MPSNQSISHAAHNFKKLFWLLKPHHGNIIKGILVGPIIGLLSMLPPYFSKLLFDNVSVNYDTSLMLVLVCGILAFSIAAAITEAGLHYYSNYLNIKLENATSLLFFNHIQHLPLSFFQQREIGEVSSRFQEIKAALGSVNSFLNVIFGQGIFLLLVPPFLFLLNWELALVAIIAIPLSSLAIFWLGNKLRASWQQVMGGSFAATQFYADIEGHPDDENVKLAMEELDFFTDHIKVLGTYPASQKHHLD